MVFHTHASSLASFSTYHCATILSDANSPFVFVADVPLHRGKPLDVRVWGRHPPELELCDHLLLIPLGFYHDLGIHLKLELFLTLEVKLAFIQIDATCRSSSMCVRMLPGCEDWHTNIRPLMCNRSNPHFLSLCKLIETSPLVSSIFGILGGCFAL